MVLAWQAVLQVYRAVLDRDDVTLSLPHKTGPFLMRVFPVNVHQGGTTAMKRKRFSETQIIGVLNEAESGVPVKELVRIHGISEQTYYRWKSKYGGMDVSDAKRLKELETENNRLKRMVADLMLDNQILKDVNSKNW